MKTNFFISIRRGLLISLATAQLLSLQAQPNNPNSPKVQWRRFDWVVNTPPFKDFQGNLIPTKRVERDESGSDWWYDLKPSFINGDPSPANHNGFVACGYSSINNNNGLEFGQTCYYQPEPAVDCNETFLNGGPLPLQGNGHISITPFFHTVAKFKPNGFTQEWMQVTPHKGNAYRVIQLNDGSFLSVGDSYSIADFNGNSLHYNGNAQVVDCLSGPPLPADNSRRLTSFVGASKISADGQQLWNNLYGFLQNPAGYTAQSFYVHEAWDAVQAPGQNGNVFVVGRQMGYSYLWEIGVDGSLVRGVDLHQSLGDLNVPQGFSEISNSTIKAVAYDPTTHDLILGLKVGLSALSNGSPLLWDAYPFNRVLMVKWNTISGSISGYGWPIDEATTGLANGTSFNQQNIYSLIRTPDGRFVAGMATGCNECDAATGNAKGIITAIMFGSSDLTSTGTGMGSITKRYFGEGQAFDFRVGVCNNVFTNHDGFALISSKMGTNTSFQAASCSCPSEPTSGLDVRGFFNTDSYMAGLDQNLNTIWESTYMDEDVATPSTCYPGNYKKQECTYTIAQAPDGGYIGGGNQSNNLDDAYLYKVFPFACSSPGYDISNNTPPNSNIPIPYYKFPQPQPFPGYQEVLWNQSKTVKGTVVIDPGICLRIKGPNTVISFEVDRVFPEDPGLAMPSRIIVRPGGKLILDGATLDAKSDCYTGMWGGIEVWGAAPADQQPNQATVPQQVSPGVFEGFSAQGIFVSMNNATIKNAFKAVTTIPMRFGDKPYELNQFDYNSTFGGLVKMTNTNIIDCRFGVDLVGYFNQDASTIDNCQFLSSRPLNAPGTHDAMVCADEPEESYTEIHCSLRGVNGVRLAGNTYACTDGDASFVGTGVRGLNAGFVAAQLLLGSGPAQPSFFINLEHGVRAGDLGASYIDIRQNTFKDVLRPISLETTMGTQVNRNTIQYTKPTLGAIGIYTKGAQGYWVRDNLLTGPPNAGLYQAGWSHGFLSENQDNLKSKLTSNILKGFWCQNRFDMTNQNLATNCNQSHEGLGLSEYTWLVTGTAANPGQLNNQKGADLNNPGLRNTFLPPTGNKSHIKCDAYARTFQYVGTQDQVNCLPSDVSLCVMVGEASSFPCLPEYYDNGTIVYGFEEVRNGYQAARLAYDSLRGGIDDKRTALLEAAMATGAYTTLQNLPASSKNKLSDDVLLAMIRHIPPPDWTNFRDALVENSPLQPLVLDSFMQAPIPLAIREQVQAAQTGISAREVLEGRLDSLEDLRLDFLGQWVQHYLASGHPDSALAVLAHDPAPAASMYGLGLCLTHKQSPRSWLNKIAAFADSLARINKPTDALLGKWLRIKQQFLALFDSTVFGQQTDTSLWQNQANLQTPQGIRANLALAWAMGKDFHYKPNPFIEVNGYRQAATEAPAIEPNVQPLLPKADFSLFPNPTEDVVTLSLPLGCQRVVLFNALGQVISQHPCVGQSTMQLSTQSLPSGLYWVQAWQAHGAISTLKLFCQHAP